MQKNTLNRLILLFIALFMLIPIAVVMFSWTKPMAEIWGHLREYILPEVLKNTAIMLIMVIIGAGGLGTLLAWFTSMYRFTGQKFFSWALMLPLAIPAYVLAFISIGIFDYSGVIQSTMRAVGIETPLPSVRNIWGAGGLFIGKTGVFIAGQTYFRGWGNAWRISFTNLFPFGITTSIALDYRRFVTCLYGNFGGLWGGIGF